jgi:hypothetical protein
MMRYLTKGDVVLIAVLTVLSFAGLGSMRLAGLSGNHAVVDVNGRRTLELPLDRDAEYSVMGPLGETVIEVRNKAVAIERSPCPRGVCMHMGWIRYPGELLVCVPNRVCVSIRGKTDSGLSFDGVSE